ncbi:MAG: replication initiation factor domain-containing protein [Proteobacteria bacterium]|nr:replication initiation factor domain-containing protein [Pseudomonadota bacterium]
MVTNNMGVVSTPAVNNCALHWLQISIPVDETADDKGLHRICEDIFQLDSFKFEASKNFLKGFSGYKIRHDYQGITIFTNHYANGGNMIYLTGSVCDAIAPDLEAIGQYVICNGGKVSRIDIAVDDHCGLLDIATINQARLDNTCITSFQKARSTNESNLNTGTNSSPTVVFGSEASDFQIRFYDRAAKDGLDSHWVRCELQLRNKHATRFLQQIAEGNSLATVAMGVLQDKLSFRIPNRAKRSRWKFCSWWTEFLQDTKKLSLGICKDRHESSIDKQLKWVEKFVAKALSTIRQEFGIKRIEAICDMGDRRRMVGAVA